MTFDELREKAHGLPLKPGVYIMRDKADTVIYVGKAKALKNRVSQYFQDSAAHTPKTRAMVAQIDHFDVIIAGSEFEALVLESAMIKRHQPRYNILLKDDKGYPYIRLSVQEEYPRFTIVSRPAKDGARYFGPYGGRGETKAIIRTLRTALRLPSCGKKFPRDIARERPCLNYHMGLCDGYCRSADLQPAHAAAVAQAVQLLEGKLQQVRGDLTGQMERAAEDLRFEEAARLRDRLRAVEQLGKRQQVVAGSMADTDVVGFFRGAKCCFTVLHFMKGELAAKDLRLLDLPLDEGTEEILSLLLRQYYEGRSPLPRRVLLPVEIPDRQALEEWLSGQAGHKAELLYPQRGAKRNLVRMADDNAREEAERALTRQERHSKLLELLARMLELDGPPRRMESYDISNTGASDIVASMVVYQDAKPLRRDYRHFKLKDMTGPDDYAAMEQVLTRRFRRYLDGDEKFADRPDLLLIDGGREHVQVAVRVLEGMGLAIPAYGMVKDDRHRTRALVAPDGREIGIQAVPALFALIGQIQEETHRFAIEYHRKLQSERVKGSVLDGIPGVGEKRRADLLRRFKTVKAVREAAEEELAAAVPRSTAKAVYDYFHGEDEK